MVQSSPVQSKAIPIQQSPVETQLTTGSALGIIRQRSKRLSKLTNERTHFPHCWHGGRSSGDREQA